MINKYLFSLFATVFLFSSVCRLEAQTTFSYTGTVQTYTVPAGVTAISVDAWGAAGGGVNCAFTEFQSVGGCGGRVQTTIAVTPGQVLNIIVGQQPADSPGTGGFGGGGTDTAFSAVWPGAGGGGATSILDNATGDTLVVSGGGGGGGGDECTATGLTGDAGGAGGGLTGGAGNSSSCGAGAGGVGGTQVAGGAASTCIGDPGGAAGTAGNGGGYSGSGSEGAGGGGGGYWGGGAGADGAGGGGGSSFTHPVFDFLVTNTSGYNGTGCTGTLGNGQTIITALCSAGTISGPSTLCFASTATFSITGSGGSWASANTAIASIDPASGLVTPVDTGTTVIYYSSGACVSAFVLSIIANPAVITGASGLCTGATTTLADATSGGSWSSSTGDATIDPALGVVTGITAGPTTITYTATGGCVATLQFTVNPTPGAITGGSSVCQGTSATLTDILSGGTWTSGNTAAATIDPSAGVINGISGFGVTVITYSIAATGCFTTTTDTVQPVPGAITGNFSVCVGAVTSLSDGSGGGSWSCSAPIDASVNPSIGAVTGVAPGTLTITYTLPGGCYSTTPVTVNPTPGAITGASSVCQGTSATLSDLLPGGTWTSSNIAVATIDPSAGAITGVSGFGISIITYSIAATGCYTTTTDTVRPVPGAITGTFSVCVGAVTSLSDAPGGGTWSSSTPADASVNPVFGAVTGVAPGTPTITYTLPGGCFTTTPVTVDAAPSAGVIAGADSVCVGLTSTLTDAGSSGVGVWSISNSAITTISGGIVSGVAAGRDTVSYTVSTSDCGSATASVPFKVNPLPNAGVISGVTVLCQDSMTVLTDIGGSGGVWSSGTASVATISSGTVTGVSGGSATISYLVINSCGSSLATADVIVSPLPTPGVITGAYHICIGANTTLTDSAMPGAGIWSSSDASVASVVATATAISVINGVSRGTATISYAVSNGCGTRYATFVITVDSIPPVGDITGIDTICVGSFFTYTDSTGGGTWSLSNPFAAYVSPVGTVSGITSGMDTILYTITNSCGSFATSKPMAVSPLPYSGIVSAAAYSVCTGSAISLVDLAPGGVWSSSDTTKAIVIAPGTVSGVSAGIVNISYSVANYCGMVDSFASVTVSPTPVVGLVTGLSHICMGTTGTLTDTTTAGTWSSSNSGVISIGSGSGVYSTMATGVDTITYSVTNVLGCQAAVSVTDTVNPVPNAGAIIATTADVCAGAVTALSDTTAGGAWSSSDNTVATVSSGTVTGVVAGTANISYTVSNFFGCSNSATEVVTVYPVPAPGSIMGVTHVCMGASAVLSDTASGGVWSSSNSSIVNIGAASGIYTTVSTGVVTLTYSLTNTFGCRAAVSVADTVNPSPNAGTITAAVTTVCQGYDITWTDTASGGVWTSSDALVATVTGGTVTGISAGTSNIFYSVTNTFGCSSDAVQNVTVHPTPVAGVILGAANVCQGVSYTLTDSVAGGTWTSSNTGIIIVGATSGVVTTVSAGNDTVTYSVSNTFGCGSSVSVMDTVYPVPNTGMISPMTANVCLGTVVTLSDTVAGGVWSSTDTAVATVAGGAVTGLTLGMDTIMYFMTSVHGCSASATATVTVNPLPGMNTITGMSAMCAGTITTFSDDSAGGIWSSSNTLIATVDIVDGTVVGIAGGIDTIFYTVFNIYGCGTSVDFTDTVIASPVVSPIIGSTGVCLGSFTILSDSVSGGFWSSLNPSIASVDSTGTVSGMALGSTAILYAVTNIRGCSTTVSIMDTVLSVPVVSAISGPVLICLGGTATMTDSTTAGLWSSSDSTVASINPTSGVVSGVAPGPFTIVYTVSNGMGCSAYATQMDTVVTAPFVPPVSAPVDTICLGTSALLTDSVTGGLWSSGNPTIATITTFGWVSGIGGGTDTLYYTVTSSAGCTRTTGFVMTVDSIPAVSILPVGGASLCHGDSVRMLVITTDTALAYQWYVDGVIIPGASTTVFTTDTAGLFTVNITTTVGCTGMLATSVINPPMPVIAITPGDTLYTTDSFTTYQWLSSDTILSGATGRSYFESTPGFYDVVVTNQYGCADTSVAFAVLGVTNVVPNINIRLFPNPATSEIHIDAPENVDVMVTTQEGKVLMNIHDTKTIDVSSLANGVYTIQLYNKNGTPLLTGKIVKMD